MILLLIPLLSKVFTMQTQQAPATHLYDARIETEKVNGKLLIRNVFENKSQNTVDLYYKFKCKREGRSGSSANSQSGSFTAAPGETVTLSKTAVSVAPSDAYTIDLEVYSNAKTIATDTYSSEEE